MAFVSFPHSSVESEERTLPIYSKMYTAATHMIQSLLHDEDSPSQSTSTGSSPGLRARAPTKSRDPETPNKGILRTTALQSSPKLQLDRGGRVESPTPTTNAESFRNESQESSSTRPQLFRTSTTSSATVGISQALAVPLLPSSSFSADTDTSAASIRSRSDASSIIPQLAHSGGTAPRAADAESLFSVNSTSASRAYLASQYSRTRSRATPGRLDREFWMKDESATSCFRCNRTFTTFRRKHHCRVCGQIFCSSCTDLIDGEKCNAPAHRRVRCCKICEDTLASHSSSEDEGDISVQSHIPEESVRWPDLAEDRARHESGTHSFAYTMASHNNQPGTPESEEDNLHLESYSRLASPKLTDDSYFARSFLGTSHNSHVSRTRSRSLTRSRSQSQFPKEEDVLTTRPARSSSQGTLPSFPLGLVQTSHIPSAGSHSSGNGGGASISATAQAETTGLNMSNAASVLGVNALTPSGAGGSSLPSTASVSGYATAANLNAGDSFPLSLAKFPNSATVELNNASLAYLQLFLEQLLKDSELDPDEWKPILTAPLLEVAAGLHLEINDKLSPREWVKIKRIPGGTPQDIDCINGTVFTHSLARRSMSQRLTQPRILLLAFPIEYARNERYMSLEPVVAQEKEYLKKLVGRITALKPNIILSCSHICGQAMDMLEDARVSVAQNIRESALFRLSKIAKADILMTIDRLNAAPQLGSCELFEQRTYKHDQFAKTFLFFFVRGADPGRCALVRGEPEISGVIKVVLEVMAEICYSLKAETALMRDQFVLVPSLKDPPEIVLSSSPFVDYGSPYLQMKTRQLEDEVVSLGNQIDETTDPELECVLTSKLENVRRRWIETAQTWEAVEAANPFMFNPSSHQNIIVLYSLVSSETATPCVGPDSQLIEFYLNTDQTLGKFVETSIAQARNACPDGCGRAIKDHYRTFVNGAGMVTIFTEKMPCKIPGLEDSILMWSYCKKCEQQMPIVPMSSTTWKCSMGKYLELTFYGQPLKMRAATCNHDVYRDHVRYFGWHGYALRIEFSSIELNEIYGPPNVLSWNTELEVKLKHQTYREWCQKLDEFWTSLYDCLGKVKVEGLEESMIDRSKACLDVLKQRVEEDKRECRESLDKVYHESAPDDYLSLNSFLEGYQSAVDQWHADLADFDSQFFPTEKDIRRVTAQHIRGMLGEDGSEKPRSIRRKSSSSESKLIPGFVRSREDDKLEPPEDTHRNEKVHQIAMEPLDAKHERFVQAGHTVEPDVPAVPTNSLAKSVPAGSTPANDFFRESNLSAKGSSAAADDPGSPVPKRATPEPQHSPSGSSSVTVKSRSGNEISVSMPSLNAPPVKGGEGRVAVLARHFEELSREFERERQKEKERLRERQRAIKMRHAHPVAEVFEDVSEAIEDWPQSQISQTPQLRLQHGRSKSQPYFGNDKANSIEKNIEDGQETEVGRSNVQQVSDPSGEASGLLSSSLKPLDRAPDLDSESVTMPGRPDAGLMNSDNRVHPQGSGALNADDAEKEEYTKAEPAKLSLIRTLANFWAERSSARWNGIEFVLGAQQHFFTNTPVVLRENEPSSLIAFCLSLPDYQARVKDFYNKSTGSQSEASMFESDHSGENIGMETGRTYNNKLLESTMLRQTGTHMRYHFDRNNVKVSCKIFFSEQFDALRRKCGASERIVQSLSRCSSWESAGGKSGSAFLKTLDDRLILKELSHAEFDSFVTFAPSYFEYMSQALFHDLPTFLAKIFGVYQITMRSTQTSQQVKMYVLVMENLFHGASFSKYFDLKGSMRNRKVTETGKANEVLLDENMVEYIYESPVFVREHSKRMLRASLYNDTLFLTKMNVMDYSLVIGLDESNNTITAGIIDYIRTYTWDKKIESWVKTRAATVGSKEPTVVSPKQYKGRFRESMERYFVMVPDCWSQSTI